MMLFLLTLMSTLCNAQENQVVYDKEDLIDRVVLKNGESIPIDKLSRVWKENLKVKIKGDKKISNIKVETVDKIIYNARLRFGSDRYDDKTGGFYVNTWKVVKVRNKNKLAAEIIDGSCSIYLYPGDSGKPAYSILAKRKGEEQATIIHNLELTAKKYKKAGARYFKDCPEVQQLIKKSKVKYKLRFLIPELKKTIGIYNETCVKN